MALSLKLLILVFFFTLVTTTIHPRAKQYFDGMNKCKTKMTVLSIVHCMVKDYDVCVERTFGKFDWVAFILLAFVAMNFVSALLNVYRKYKLTKECYDFCEKNKISFVVYDQLL